MLKSLIWWNLLEKREALLYEKALKRDICAVRFALTALFSLRTLANATFAVRFVQLRMARIVI
jgi:hypothetical protein